MLDIRVTDSDRLTMISDVIHDFWFKVGDVQFDAARRVLRVHPIQKAPGKSRETSAEQYTLVIGNVSRLILEDTEGIDSYDINKLSFSAKSSSISLLTNIPLRFIAEVSDLDVRLISA